MGRSAPKVDQLYMFTHDDRLVRMWLPRFVPVLQLNFQDRRQSPSPLVRQSEDFVFAECVDRCTHLYYVTVVCAVVVFLHEKCNTIWMSRLLRVHALRVPLKRVEIKSILYEAYLSSFDRRAMPASHGSTCAQVT
jgi:hypothetical protein